MKHHMRKRLCYVTEGKREKNGGNKEKGKRNGVDRKGVKKKLGRLRRMSRVGYKRKGRTEEIGEKK